MQQHLSADLRASFGGLVLQPPSPVHAPPSPVQAPPVAAVTQPAAPAAEPKARQLPGAAEERAAKIAAAWPNGYLKGHKK
jgi:hypothetical protein